MHELGHVLGLRHTFQDFICPGSADCSASACSYYVNGDVCSGAINTGCAVYPISLGNTGNDNVDDTPIDHRCGSGIGITSDPWTMSYCDQPEEIANNYMTYRTIAIPGGFTAGQQNVILNYASNFAMSPILQESVLFSEDFGDGDTDLQPCGLPDGGGWSNGSPPLTLPQSLADSAPQDGNVAFTAEQLMAYGCGMRFLASATNSNDQGYASLTTPIIDLTNPSYVSAKLNWQEVSASLNLSQFVVLIYDVDANSYIQTIIPTTTIDLSPYLGKRLRAVFYLYNDDDNVHMFIRNVSAKVYQVLPINPTQVPTWNTTPCLSANAVQLSWTSPIITAQYILSYRVQGTTNWTIVNVTSFSNPNLYQLTGLLPNTTYQVMVQSVYNFCGTDINQQSNPSSILEFTTPASSQLISTNSNFCANDNTILNVATGSYSIEWSTGGLSNSINALTAGTYSVSITSANGNCIYDEVEVYQSPTPVIVAPNGFYGCSNNPIVLSTQQPYVNYNWIDAALSTANTPTFNTIATGYAYVTVTDANGCTGVATTYPIVNPPPVASIIPTNNDCNVTLHVEGQWGNVYPYVWYNGSTTNITVNTPGTYTATVSQPYTTNGVTWQCSSVVSTNITSIPQITATITPTLNNCSVTLTAAGGSSYVWSNGATSASIEVLSPSTYTVTVTNTNGCTATAQYGVTVAQITTIADFSGDYTVGAMTNPLGVYDANPETWYSPNGLRIQGQIIVPDGQHLIIAETTLEMIGHDSRITIQKGGKMTVTNQAVLRGDACTNDYWKGIRVLGDGTGHTGNSPQVNFNTGHYGWLRVFNGSTIQDAQIGIANTTDDLSTANSGGIISCTASNLIDNGQGVFLMPVKKYNNCSIITDNQFSFTQTYNYPYLSGSLTQQIGMVAVLTRFSNNLQNNRFVNTTNNNIIDLGTGYVLLSCRANIGGSGLYDGITEFSNLFKGIDAYNLWALEDQIKVHDNDFEQVHKGVSLNNGVFSGVFNNSFTNIQNGDNTGAGTAYGVYARNTYGIQIANNNFACSAPNNNGLQNIGVVLDNTGSYQNTLVNNSFSGNFGRATTFINTNKNVLADCNLYALNNNIDWYINGTLQDQGVCIVPTPELARRNSFHNYMLGINSYNILKADDGGATPTFNYVGQVGFNPQFIAGGVAVDLECEATEPISHCTLNPDNCDPDCLLAQIDEATDNQKLIELYSYLLRQRIDLNQIEWGKLDLSRENRIDAQKVLIATLESQDSTEIALQKLADLPVESPDDAAFKTLYYQLLTGITPPAGSGKAMPAQEQLLRNTANTNNTTNAAMAQSIVATYYHQTFNKNVPAVELNETPNSLLNWFKLQPNPAANQLTITVNNQITLPTTLLIHDIYNRVVKSVFIDGATTTININDLPNGVYLCEMEQKNTNKAVQKLIIIH